MKANETVLLQKCIVNYIGVSAYLEIHNIQTNDRGLGNVTIGEGITTDDLSFVNWATGPYFIDYNNMSHENMF